MKRKLSKSGTGAVEVIDVESMTFFQGQSSNEDAASDTEVEIIEATALLPQSSSPSGGNVMKCSAGEEVQILHCSTVNALNVYTHPRFLCALYPFAAANYKNSIPRTTANNQLHCPKCFCCICQIEVSKCKNWKHHCNANGVSKQPTWTTQEVIDVDEEDESSEDEFENGKSSKSEETTTKSIRLRMYEPTSESEDGSSIEPKTTSKKLHKTRGGNSCISTKCTNISKALKARRSNSPAVMEETFLSAKRNTSSEHETSLTKTKVKSNKKQKSSTMTKKKTNKPPGKKDSLERISSKRLPKPNTPSNASPAVKVNSNIKGEPSNSSKNKRSSTTTKKQSNKQVAKKGNTAASKKPRKISSA